MGTPLKCTVLIIDWRPFGPSSVKHCGNGRHQVRGHITSFLVRAGIKPMDWQFCLSTVPCVADRDKDDLQDSSWSWWWVYWIWYFFWVSPWSYSWHCSLFGAVILELLINTQIKLLLSWWWRKFKEVTLPFQLLIYVVSTLSPMLYILFVPSKCTNVVAAAYTYYVKKKHLSERGHMDKEKHREDAEKGLSG